MPSALPSGKSLDNLIGARATEPELVSPAPDTMAARQQLSQMDPSRKRKKKFQLTDEDKVHTGTILVNAASDKDLNLAGIDSAAHDRNFREEETRFVLAERVRMYRTSGQLHFQGSAPKVDKILLKSLIIIPIGTSMYMLVLWPVEHPVVVNRQMQSEDHLPNVS
ncbi:uncharacterized protein F5147DRAFT_652171 [Suillus discolor]|uniref:Uncharacterized protein n=1 Tax=Suillus discolor TaxID=1912936 RepID=A0A9P7FA92_9AGAM|nr:uncharacterized protein F5147DRAFT_652171 [Suillus discolor]KAG2110001.1 hypothetical protein F5147DRAFT_652171 [Suillus discolor]